MKRKIWTLTWVLAMNLGAQPEDRSILIAVVDTEKYCVGPLDPLNSSHRRPSDVTLRLSVKLTYQNEGVEPLILPLLRNSRIMIMREDPAASVTIINSDSSDFRYDLKAAGVPLEFPTEPFFAIVHPHGSESLVETVNLHIGEEAGDFHFGEIISLRLEVDHAKIPANLLQELSAKWKSHGQIWSGQARSNRVEVALTRPPQLPRCLADFRIN